MKNSYRTIAAIISVIALMTITPLPASEAHPEWGSSMRQIRKAWDLHEDSPMLIAGRNTPNAAQAFKAAFDDNGGLVSWISVFETDDPVDAARTARMLRKALSEKYSEKDADIWTDENGDTVMLVETQYADSRRIGSPTIWAVMLEWTSTESRYLEKIFADRYASISDSI